MTDIDVAAIERMAVSLRDERNQFRDECSKLADQVERLKADRRALDIAVTGLRELEDVYESLRFRIDGSQDDKGVVYGRVRGEISTLLQKIGGTR